MSKPAGEVTRLLPQLGESRTALDRLLPHVYEDLRVAARAQLRRHGPMTALQPTVLVHEAYLKLSRAGSLHASDRAHFMALAARAMRQIVVDQARAKVSQKRGGGWQQVTLSAGAVELSARAEDLVALDRALERLDERQRQVVECRFFAGLEESEIAAALGVSTRTVRREWVKARAWLYAELYGAAGGDERDGS